MATLATALHLVEFLVRGYAWGAIVCGFQGSAWTTLNRGWRPFGDLPRHLLADSLRAVGYAVAGSWLALALGRRWHPEPGWIDRIGRALGLAWIGMIVVSIVLRASSLFS